VCSRECDADQEEEEEEEEQEASKGAIRGDEVGVAKIQTVMSSPCVAVERGTVTRRRRGQRAAGSGFSSPFTLLPSSPSLSTQPDADVTAIS
jgi:hypothetical protein